MDGLPAVGESQLAGYASPMIEPPSLPCWRRISDALAPIQLSSITSFPPKGA
jgi:hypothetical protein